MPASLNLSLRSLTASAWLAGWNLTAALRRPPRGAFRILLLHDVPASERPMLDRLLARLAKDERLISPEQAEAYLDGRETGTSARLPVLVSFDDGFASNLEIAETLLAAHRVRALFFVCPGLMAVAGDDQRRQIASQIFAGRRRPEELPAHIRLMTWPELQRLRQLGHTIGNHTLHHCQLSALDTTTVRSEIEGSANAFREHLGVIPKWFAYPFGNIESINAEALMIASHYHAYCRSGVRGANDATTHRLGLLAEHIDLSAPESFQHAAVEGALDFRYRAARARLAQLGAQATHGGDRPRVA